jgi:hypothetical protein
MHNGPGYPQGLFVLLPLKLAKNRIECLAVLDFSFSGPCGIAFVMFAAFLHLVETAGAAALEKRWRRVRANVGLPFSRVAPVRCRLA